PSVLVTFDDAYRSLVLEALPVLEELDHPAVVFVPTAYIGGTNSFDADEEPAEPICNWDDLVTLESHGVSIQSHGVHHAAMSELEPRAQRAELEESRRCLTRDRKSTRLNSSHQIISYGGLCLTKKTGLDGTNAARAPAPRQPH